MEPLLLFHLLSLCRLPLFLSLFRFLFWCLLCVLLFCLLPLLLCLLLFCLVLGVKGGDDVPNDGY
jgi:hypothetical protein